MRSATDRASRSQAARALLVACGLVLAACGSKEDHVVSASDYDRSCVVDTDCVAVYSGIVGCCGAGCPNASIASAESSRYSRDLAAAEPTCIPRPPCALVLCVTPQVACINGTCAP